MTTVSMIQYLASGLPRTIDLSLAGNALLTNVISIGTSGANSTLTKTILDALAGTGGSVVDASAYHQHDGRYYQKSQVDTLLAAKLSADGSVTATGALDMGSHQIHNVTDPTSAQDAATKAYVDSHAGTAASALDGTFVIENTADNTKEIAFDASAITTGTKRTIHMPDADVSLGLVATALQKDGSVTATGDLNMGSHKISNVTDPALAQDAATKNYTDTTFIPLTQKAAANGVASLDSGGKVPAAQLPSTLMNYKGAWDASTNTPTLADGTGTNGDVYRASVAGTQNLGSGSQTWAVGDFVIYNGSIWQHSPAADGVSSVNGNTGAVTVNAINQLTGDVTAGPASGSASAAATIAAGAVTPAKLGTVTDGVTLDQAGAGSTLEIKAGGVGTTQLAASAVTAAKLGAVTDGTTLDQSGAGSTLEIKAGGVGTTQLANNAVTSAKLATSVAGNGLTGGGGTALSVTGVFASLTNANAGTLGAGTVVYISANNSFDAANAGASSTSSATIGVLSASTATTATGSVQVAGICPNVTGGGAWTAGSRIYVDVTSGHASSTAPSTSGQAIFLLGIAVNATDVLLQPQLIAVLS